MTEAPTMTQLPAKVISHFYRVLANQTCIEVLRLLLVEQREMGRVDICEAIPIGREGGQEALRNLQAIVLVKKRQVSREIFYSLIDPERVERLLSVEKQP